MRNEVEICNKSKDTIEDTYNLYKKRDFNGDEVFNKRLIIHLYPNEDTINDENEESCGYEDVLISKFRIFDIEKRIEYIGSLFCDEVYICDNDKKLSVKIRIFKDGSTMIIIDGRCRIISGQAVGIYSVQADKEKSNDN